MKTYCEYILTNRTGTLYVGITSDLPKRLYEHRTGAYEGFVSRYHLDRLIYYESFDRAEEAIAREKQVKRWRREKKIRLIAEQNPEWQDLSAEVMW